MLRVIQEIQPTWVIAENVYGIINWNDGLVFEQIHSDLETLGYEVQAFILPACSVDAPHRRYRVWFVAHSDHYGRFRRHRKDEEHSSKARQLDALAVGSHVSDSNRAGLERSAKSENAAKSRKKTFKQFARLCLRGYWSSWATQPAICSRDDGLPAELDGITISKWRRETIKMQGNAVVPQVVLQIFTAILHTYLSRKLH